MRVVLFLLLNAAPVLSIAQVHVVLHKIMPTVPGTARYINAFQYRIGSVEGLLSNPYPDRLYKTGVSLKVGGSTYNLSKSDSVTFHLLANSALESATPGTVIRFKIKNTSAQQHEISLPGWLQNMVARELEKKDDLKINRSNSIITKDGFTSISEVVKNGERLTLNFDEVTLGPNEKLSIAVQW